MPTRLPGSLPSGLDRDRIPASVPRSTGWRRVALLFLVGLVSFVYLARLSRWSPYHSDEAGWVAVAHYYTALAVHGDSDPEHWEAYSKPEFGTLNPPLGKWWLGLPLVARYGGDHEVFRGEYNLRQSLAWNVSAGAFEPRAAVALARLASALAGALCCVAVFLLAGRVAGAGGGLLAVVLALSNDLFLRQTTRAMTDSPYLMFLLLGLLAVAWLLHHPEKRTLPGCLAVGLFSGLAGSVKITGVILGLLSLAAVLLLGVAADHGSWKRSALGMVAAAALGVATMVAVNPYLWPIAVDRRYAAATLAPGVSATYADWRAGSTAERLVVRPEAPLRLWGMARQWSQLLERQAREQPGSWGKWEGNRMGTFHRELLRWSSVQELPHTGLLLVPALVGLTFAATRKLRKGRLSALTMLVAAFLVNYLFILALQKLNWDRYYLPTVLLGQVLIAIFLANCGRVGWNWVRARMASPPTEAEPAAARA